ncbi:MAG: SRPBCC domain-containing protein [Pseudoruegeria sp.]
MTTVTMERVFKAAPDTVFKFVTQTDHLLRWWGPEGMHVPEHNLSFEAKGPWMSTMQNEEGQKFKVSGHVTHVEAPHSVGFTWAWHDENNARGVESHVTIKLVPDQSGGTKFTLTHAELPGDEVAQNHVEGWTSSLRRLNAIAN